MAGSNRLNLTFVVGFFMSLYPQFVMLEPNLYRIRIITWTLSNSYLPVSQLRD
ncbi:hypothetical protein SPWS13_0863 [Shewanella putrefaciens]|nr:hypothetical protein SPWS13_0863 [Shewanella putrefaciens]